MNSDSDILINGKKFLPYNTGSEPLPLPEYGRNIQQMVDHCVMIPDREERTACAYSIINVMKTLFPKEIADKADDKKFWDHLNIMARYELDIDFPCQIAGPEEHAVKPTKVPYTSSRIQLRLYGRIIEEMIDRASAMEPSEERDFLIDDIVNQMKKTLVEKNPETATNGRVMQDLARLSKGSICLDPVAYFVPEYKDFSSPQKSAKKKKNLYLKL